MGADSGVRGGLCARAETGVERNAYLGARSFCLPVWNTRSVEHKRFDLKVCLILRTWQSQMHHFRGAAEEGGKFRPRPIHIIIVKLQDEVGRTISYCKRHLDSGRTRTHVCSDRGQSHVFAFDMASAQRRDGALNRPSVRPSTSDSARTHPNTGGSAREDTAVGAKRAAYTDQASCGEGWSNA